jgi:hypothetical protein
MALFEVNEMTALRFCFKRGTFSSTPPSLAANLQRRRWPE